MPRTIKEFSEKLSENLLTAAARGDVAILAGDFVLGPDAKYTKNYGIYPDSSLEIASKVILETRDKLKNNISMFIVINDWKYLTGNPHSEEIRKTYWSNPEFDLRQRLNPELSSHLLPGRPIKISHSGNATPDLSIGRYSEQKLHTDYSHFLRRSGNQEKLRQLFADTGFAATDKCESKSCTLNSCASEMIMILTGLYKSNIRKIITLLPSECSNPLERGTEIFTEGRHIFLPEFAEPLQVDNFYLNCTGPKTEAELFEVNLPQSHLSHLIK